MEDVTAKVKAGINDDTPVADALAKRNAAIASIEKECAAKTGNVCSVVNLYSGGRYDLYQYRRYNDLRLVFAPELQLPSSDASATASPTCVTASMPPFFAPTKTASPPPRPTI